MPLWNQQGDSEGAMMLKLNKKISSSVNLVHLLGLFFFFFYLHLQVQTAQHAVIIKHINCMENK